MCGRTRCGGEWVGRYSAGTLRGRVAPLPFRVAPQGLRSVPGLGVRFAAFTADADVADPPPMAAAAAAVVVDGPSRAGVRSRLRGLGRAAEETCALVARTKAKPRPLCPSGCRSRCVAWRARRPFRPDVAGLRGLFAHAADGLPDQCLQRVHDRIDPHRIPEAQVDQGPRLDRALAVEKAFLFAARRDAQP